MSKFYVEPHIPHGSGDAEYRIKMDVLPHLVIAIVDPDMEMSDPDAVRTSYR